MKSKLLIVLGLASVAALTFHPRAKASDHDDGEIDLKGRAVNLTDVFAFVESWQVTGGDSKSLVLIMNSNPRSLPTQQYFFSTQALYDFHVSRVGTNHDVPGTTNDDVILRFQFGAPDSNNIQPITMTPIIEGSTGTSVSAGSTTTVSASTPTANSVTVNGTPMTVFAGLREDPFVFDVEAFFRFRAAAASSGGKTAVPSSASFPAASPQDFTTGLNANSIVVKAPISFFQANGETVFDVWCTISVPL